MPRRSSELPVDPYESARIAGLRYVTDDTPGIVRKRSVEGFVYFGPGSQPVEDHDTLERIRSLAIPPAWEQVWICLTATGHLQAVGRDARGRRQYRYHPLYRLVRDQTKFSRMQAFGKALPGIRCRVAQDLALPGLPKNKVRATVARLLEITCIRVGNDEYAEQNGSFGLTTLRNKHVKIEGRTLRFHFRGKSGIVHDIELNDRRMARILRDCQCIAGHELFHFVDDDGAVCRIHSEDVNEYLREIAGEDFTAKDFRTWNGTIHAALHLESLGPASSETDAKKNIVAAIGAVAERLGNRPATCRKFYVHPAVLDAYTEGTLIEALKTQAASGSPYALRREEAAVMNLLANYKVNALPVGEPAKRKAA